MIKRYVQLVLLFGAMGAAGADSPQDKFSEAAGRGNFKLVKKYLEQGVDPNSRDTRFGCPAIVIAAQKGHLDVVKLLQQNKADVCAGDDFGWTALHAAATYKHNTVLEYLMKNGAQVNQVTRTLLAKMAPGCSGEAALACAARAGNKEGVTLLLNNGADVHQADMWGRTALFWTAARGYTDIFDYLLTKGASINETNRRDGRTLLHSAAVRENNKLARFLLSRGIAVDAQDHQGQTALAAALDRKGSDLYPTDAETALLLLQFNADPKRVGLDDQDIRWWYGDGSLTIPRIRHTLSAINTNNKN